MKNRHNRSVALAALLLCFVTTWAIAQPPGFGGRGGPGGFFGGRGGGPGGGGDPGSDFRQRMMERMDENRNGKLEENEVSDRARGFLEAMVRRSGKEVKYPISISDITGRGSRGSGRDRGRDRRRNDNEEEFEYPLVKGFGEDTMQTAFGVNPNLLNGRIIDIEKNYDERSLSTLERTMDRYDKDGNGVLEYEEWREVSWQSDPRDSDLDNDGRLTRAEMAERYRQRYGGSSDRGRDRGRGGSDRGRGGSDRGRGGSDRGRGGDDRGRGGSPFGGSSFGGFGRGGPGGGFSFGGRGGGPPGGFSGFMSRAGGGDRGGRGGDRGGGDRGRGSSDPTERLRRLDSDGDGYIDFDRMDPRVKGFVGRMFQGMGIEAKGKVKISDVAKKITRARGGGGGSEEAETPGSSRTDGADRFDGDYSFRQEKREAKGMPRWWEDRDANADGQVSMAEYFTSRSASRRREELRDFEKLDLNRDGIITPSEAESVDD